MAAQHNAPDICMEGHCVTKGYGDQTRNQRCEGLLRQKDEALSSYGERLVHCNDRSLRLRSKRLKSHKNLSYSRGQFNSLGTCSSEHHKVLKKDTSQCRSQRFALLRFRSSSMIESIVIGNSAGDVHVARPSGGHFSPWRRSFFER